MCRKAILNILTQSMKPAIAALVTPNSYALTICRGYEFKKSSPVCELSGGFAGGVLVSSGGLPTLTEACLASSESLLGDRLPCLQHKLASMRKPHIPQEAATFTDISPSRTLKATMGM